MIIEITNPELETLIRERLETGGFRDVEDVLMQALRLSVPGEAAVPSASRSKQPLGQFLLESPLRGSGLKLERQKDFPRRVDL